MASADRLPVDLPGLDEDLRRDVEERIEEFERDHERDVLQDGAGWVPRVTGRDYAIAVAINAVVVAWLVAVLVRG
jgi:hypothetical protein